MPLAPTLTVAQLQQNFVAAWASALNPAFGVNPANIGPGNPIQAMGFATAGATTYLQSWMQGLVDYSRASTAVGSELDSWLADFNFTRPPGNPATGYISVPTPTGQVAASAVPIVNGQVFQTDPIVVSPSTIPTVYYFKTTSAATIAVGQTSVLVPYISVQNSQGLVTTQGAIYNGIPASTALQFSSGVVGTGNPVFALGPGIGSGSAAPQGGTTVASDPQARAAFVEYIDSLAGSIESALVAGIEEVSSYLQNGSTFALWDFSTQPSGVTLAFPGQAVCVFVSPNPGYSGQYAGPLGTDPIADGILNAMNGSLANSIDAVAYTVVPLVYYANNYEITALAISAMWISQGQLNAAGLSLSQLQSALQGAFQALVGAPNGVGLGISIGLAWSVLIDTMLNFSVTQPSGAVVSGIVTDVTVAGLTGTVQKYVNGSPTGSPVPYTSGLGYASLFVASTTSPDGISWTAIAPGITGNAITITQNAPSGGSSTATVTGNAIVISPKTGETNAGLITAIASALAGLVTGVATGVNDLVVSKSLTKLAGGVSPDGGMVPSLDHQATIEGTGDPSGVLRWNSTLNVHWPTPNYVP